MGDSEVVKVVVRKSDLGPGLKNIDLKSLREVLAKAQSKRSIAVTPATAKKSPKEPVVLRQFSTPEKIILSREPAKSPAARKIPAQRVVSIKPGTWTQPSAAPKRVSFGPEKIPSQYRKVHILRPDKTDFSCCFCEFTSSDAEKYRKHVSAHVRNKAFRCSSCEFSTDSIAAYNKHLTGHQKAPIGPLYGCSVCDFKALSPQALIKHKASLKHNKLKENPTFTCKICNFKDVGVLKIAQHIVTHDGIETADCEKCDHPGVAQKHHPKCAEIVDPLRNECEDILVRPRKRQFNCTLCDFKSDEILFLTEHIKAHARAKSGAYDEPAEEDMPFCCTMCDYRCVRPAKLSEHMKAHKTQSASTIFCCKECNFKSKNITAFKLHWKSHTTKAGGFKCFVCLTAFSSSADLTDHMIVHSKGKPFACNVCDYQCLTKQQLLDHLKTHSKKKTQVFFPCPLCKNKYSTSAGLRQHLQTHSSRDKPFKCEYCDFSSYSGEMLKVHLAKHAAEFKHRCKICQSSFSTEADLKSHVLDHVTLMTPNDCSICDRTFPSKALLAKHQASQHPDSVFSCEVCRADFIDERDYNTHILEHEMAENDTIMEVEHEASKNTADPQDCGYVEEQVYAESEPEEEADQVHEEILGYPMVTE